VDGARGKQPGEPKSLMVDRKGFLYVLDTMASYVDVMDLLGNPVRRIDPASLLGGGIDSTAMIGYDKSTADVVPVAMALDPEDLPVLAIGGQRSRIVGLDEHDGVRWTLDGSEGGDEPFSSVAGLFVDAEGRIFVADGMGAPAVRAYSPDGRRLLGFGTHDAGNENFSLPASVATTGDGRIWVLDTLRQVVQAARGVGALVFLECQAHQGSLEDPEIVEALRLVDIFAPNATEAMQVSGEDSPQKALDRLGEFTPLVVVKLGVGGAIARRGAETARADGLAVECVDTTGAGDNFDCGFLYGLLKGYSLEDCLNCGNICGGLSVTTRGGASSSPTAQMVEEWRARLAAGMG
jgi:hypothetical protein